MSKVIYDVAASLNGWIADEHGSLDWLFDAGDPPEGSVPENATVYVEGSATYEWVVRHEDLLAHPEKWAAFYGSRPTFVFTARTLPIPAGADVRFVSGAVADAFPLIEAAAGEGDIWVVGGGELAGQFLDAGLLDEIAVSVAPAVLTGGAPLLPRVLGADRLELRSVQKAGPFARLVYSVLR